MGPIFQIVGKTGVVEIFGIRLVGVSVENGKKVLFTVAFILALLVLRGLLRGVVRLAVGKRIENVRFWSNQGIRILITVLFLTGIISIWFNNPTQLGSAATFITAGLAVASQRAITALFGYFIILRGKTFNVGDRIVMGGVRGDVIALGFMQTTIMEMGEPPGEQSDAPSIWVAARQYTGRIVTITNDKLFDTPVYNYTRDFPYIWEEMRLPIPYNSDHKTAEGIILEAARHCTVRIAELSEAALNELTRRYAVQREELEPRVFYRLTDNWCEMAVRFITEDHGIRKVKDKMSREILDNLSRAKIGIASGTYEVVGMPELRVRVEEANGAPRRS